MEKIVMEQLQARIEDLEKKMKIKSGGSAKLIIAWFAAASFIVIAAVVASNIVRYWISFCANSENGSGQIVIEEVVRRIMRDEYAIFQTDLQNILIIVGFLLTFLAIAAPLMGYFQQKERMAEMKVEHQEKMAELEDKQRKQHEEINKQFDKKISKVKALGDQRDLSDLYIGDETIDKRIKEYVTEGNIAFYNEDYIGAIYLYKKAEESLGIDEKSNPKSMAAICSNLARAYWRLNKYFKALKYSEKAILLDPSQARYFYQRGANFREIECYCTALRDINKAIGMRKTEPESVERNDRLAGYFSGRAAVLYELGRYFDALEDDKKAIQYASQYNKAQFYSSRAITHKALAEIAIDPDQKAKYERLAQDDEETAAKLANNNLEHKGDPS